MKLKQRAEMRRRLASLAFGLPFLAALWVPLPAHSAENDWPCIQRKVVTLTAAQMWDGPEIDGLAGWEADAEMSRLIKSLVSRANPIERATESLRQWAEALPEAARDGRLKLLFAGVLKAVNDDRAAVMSGIERFQRRQRQLAERIQEQGARLGELRHRAASDGKAAAAELSAAEDRYRWDTRFFAERQESLPHACEIPVQIEQRAFDLARAIRALMKD